jgi:hypothetical protein
MRASLIGTSNAIRKGGYSQALADSDIISDFWRGTFGKSSPLVFSLFGADLDRREDDVVLIELCVNAAVMLGSKQDARGLAEDTPENVRSSFCDLIERCLLKGKVPIFVVWPCLQAFGFPEAPIFGIIQEVIEKYAIPWFDGYALLRRIMAAKGTIEPGGFFYDKSHIAAPIAYEIGKELPSLMQRALEARSQNGSAQSIGVRNDVLQLAPLAQVGSHKVVIRITSIMKLNFLRLQEGEAISFDLQSGSQVVGLCFDASTSHGVLEINDEERTRYLLDSYEWMPDDTAATRLFTMPIRRPIVAKNGHLEIKVGTGRAEINDPPERQWPPAAPSRVAQATLYGLVIRRDIEQVWVPKPLSGPLDLSQYIGDMAVKRIASAAQ